MIKQRKLTKKEQDLAKEAEALEAQVMELLERIQQSDKHDKRSLALARTNIEQGVMWLKKGIAKPVLVKREKKPTDKRPTVKKGNLEK